MFVLMLPWTRRLHRIRVLFVPAVRAVLLLTLFTSAQAQSTGSIGALDILSMFREFTFWELYKWQILGVGALFVIQTSLIAGLLVERARRSKAAHGLSESEERYRNVVQTQTELICRYLPDTTITFVNDAYCRYFNKSKQELIGTKFLDLIPEHARQDTLAYVQSLLEDPRIQSNEHEALLPDGSITWQHWIDHVITNGNGRVKEIQGIGRDITERKLAEEARRHAENELSQLTARLFNLQDEERRRIARELHDGTAQNLFAISIDIDLMRKQTHNGDSEFKSLLDESASLCDQSLQEIRTLSYLLHPPLLDQAGLVSALHWYVDGFIKRTGISVSLVALESVGRMGSEVETALFRIVQESLTNIRRHSGSETVSIRLWRNDDQILLEIEDHGHGVKLTDSIGPIDETHLLGVGIPGMRQRLRQLGGRLDILTGASGTLVTAIIPCIEVPSEN